ncbi:MAG: monovalent cation/H+ antiporter complex subunit F [Dermatophilus congolensis]|nr:monovalent cation/H+ antiporter complex subunit F [Dermatophilus congolensis]
MTTSDTIVVVLIVVLAAAALMSVTRIIRGPTVMDRAVANEVLVSTIVCMLGLEAAITRDMSTLPILISLSVIGFVSSVAVARFASNESEGVDADELHIYEAHEIEGLPEDPASVPVTRHRDEGEMA